ncbi:Integrase core domain protein [Roseovarius tolerans]|uniref:Integrase core domain protein n=1 Tax=Roseovarius tolerans TaxID=74031 RepID=A0A0L6CV41_9RHOB|nr:DDE-type integrase/transposase/recombinase [Roseovarius tolerans]KNX41591.1 Integrase core domain protein [Roseovarius tolerans]
MISTPHRQTATLLIEDAVTTGARRAKACAELEISDRTLRRWRKDGQLHADQRPLVPRPEPANKLSTAERAAVLEACNSTDFASLPPCQIVPKLADQGRYLASESSFYRILRADGQQHHRGRAKPPVRRKPPTSYKASAPCEVWTWDITWMPGPVVGMFFYLYLIVDIFSRKIVGWEVHERESADLAAVLIRQAVLAEGCFMQPLVLHADNGSPMKGATMKTTMEKLGITASYSRPRVSNDNPFSEALFRTCKYRPDCQRRSKIQPQGGAKTGHFGFGRNARHEAAASQPRFPNSWRLTGRFGPSGPNLDRLDQALLLDLRARL